ncbi:hypothetical protein M9H77_35222 [Catharanthus roseus]|uniref:Uncharacterized protein n=1 Tax=Catharanthus roseus TaxID=4058 RepID=A0ACB9ZSN6_CATRO|nr:hypothetical protein M9H77_35222 [Catharanthus roseus]
MCRKAYKDLSKPEEDMDGGWGSYKLPLYTRNEITAPWCSLPFYSMSTSPERPKPATAAAHILPYLHNQQLMGFVDGTASSSSKTIIEKDSQVPNPAYQAWILQDQLVLSTLLSFLAPEVLQQLLFLSTSQELNNQPAASPYIFFMFFCLTAAAPLLV